MGAVSHKLLLLKKLKKETFGMVSTWQKKKRKTSKIMNAGSNNKDERDRKSVV